MKQFIMPLIVAVGLAFLPACNEVTKRVFPVEFVAPNQQEDVKINHKTGTAYINVNYMNGNLFDRQMNIVDGFGIKHLILSVNCGGGGLFDMFSMVDRMKRFQANGGTIAALGHGIIASAAVPIFVLADLRIAGEHTAFMIHPHSMWGQLDEDSEWFKKEILEHPSYKTLYKKMGNLWNEYYAGWISDRSDFTYDEVIEMLTTLNATDGQWWMTAKEMKEKKAIDILK